MPTNILSSILDLKTMDAPENLAEKIHRIHQLLKDKIPTVDRIAVALYDEKTDLLKTFIHSTDGNNPLPLYQCKLDDAPALKEIHLTGQPRVINKLKDLPSNQLHTRQIQAAGFESSFTQALYCRQKFMGFIFFNASQENAFTQENLHELTIIAYLINVLLTNEFNTLTTLNGMIHSLEDVTQFRDQETGYHLERMSRYSRIIARAVAKDHNLSDEYVEYLFLFSGLQQNLWVKYPIFS